LARTDTEQQRQQDRGDQAKRQGTAGQTPKRRGEFMKIGGKYIFAQRQQG
jgi:hypothetical protein